VRRLRQAGIVAGILCSPLLPGITDTEAAIDRMARLAAEANASFFAANPLFLKPCSRPTYLSFVREHFPALVADYERRFAHADFASKSYAAHLRRIVSNARQRHGLDRRWREDDGNLSGPAEDQLNFAQGQHSGQYVDPRPRPPERKPPAPPRKQPANAESPRQQRLFG
jgi:hypothetical protein